jgi:hypothetical protein
MKYYLKSNKDSYLTLFMIQSPTTFSATGDIVSSMLIYSEGDPVFAV